MRNGSRLLLLGTMCLMMGAGARDAFADGAFTVFGGANVGDDIQVLTDDDSIDLGAAIENSPLFGLRVGSYSFPFGFEGSLTYSKSALVRDDTDTFDIETDILFVEDNALLIILPGPVAPFFTAGFGVHYLDFQLFDLTTTSQTNLGWNLGGGVKINVARVALRIDVRDHVTSIALDDLEGLGFLGLADASARVHNVEVSFGVGIRF